ncbi:hypothetical protein D516_2274 [Rhodobacter sp. AKP1]|nr:hypothetical protein D516_2274 [Rhodobacter sp. AKP1]
MSARARLFRARNKSGGRQGGTAGANCFARETNLGPNDRRDGPWPSASD